VEWESEQESDLRRRITHAAIDSATSTVTIMRAHIKTTSIAAPPPGARTPTKEDRP
jgi:hypothetical protein